MSNDIPSVINPELIEKYNNIIPLGGMGGVDPSTEQYSALMFLEDFLDFFGLMRGDYAPTKRIVFGTLLTACTLSYLEPSLTHINGQPRPWKLLDNSQTSTWTPWWLLSGSVGFVLGVFI